MKIKTRVRAGPMSADDGTTGGGGRGCGGGIIIATPLDI
ncbi:hypothetical protein SAMN05443572_11610 [Myxococcus fulvus]|jgi:hypothetical protein|uniref:Lipoprotein n=1 Tax=Myxococcus fulvus TaxID=33 RepID=A0ABY1CW74_MYXFU|nr:hypothetical protein MFUL124B02_41640 [Myxococcus fulvus 124B02]SEU40824.1 hypothetical protein SAMN05443572_11610 [Myxococcus fulvus]